MEFSAFAGIANYDGDLATTNVLKRIGNSRPAAGVGLSYSLSTHFQLKGQIAGMNITASDADSPDEGKQSRNLSFKSSVIEGSLQFHYNILGYDPQRRYNFSPYVYAGISFFQFNPKALYNGNWYDLQPLGTEGQGLPQYPGNERYKLNQISIPAGIGVKYALSQSLAIYLDLGMRKTFTDYLDDVSSDYVSYGELLEGNGELAAALGNRVGEYLGSGPILDAGGTGRGNPGSKDWYMFGVVGVSYVFDNIQTGFGGARRRNAGCPTF